MTSRPVVHKFGPFKFDPSQRQLTSGAESSTLSNSLNKLLLLFVSRPGKLVTRDEIAQALWEEQGTVDVVAGTNTAIKRLRTQLGDNNGHGVFIETVVGAGYRFSAPVTTTVEAYGPPQIKATSPTLKRRIWMVSAVALLLLTLFLGGALYSTHRAARHATESSAAPLLLHGHPVTFDEAEDHLTAQAISPSGTYLAYADRSGITLQTLATGAERRLDSPKSLVISHIAWTPDEHALLVSGSVAAEPHSASGEASPQVWLIALGSEPAQLLLDDAELATVSPANGRIAALRAHRTEVWIYSPNGDSPYQLVRALSTDSFTCLLWSPNGDRVVVDRLHHGLPVLAGADLNPKEGNQADTSAWQDQSTYETYNATSGALLNSRDNLHFDSAVLLKDGLLLYPVNAPSPESQLAILKTDPATGAVLAPEKRIPSREVWSSYAASRMDKLSASADGKSFAVIVDRDSTDVYTAHVTTGSSPTIQNITRLTHHIPTGYPTAWSLDGTKVIFDNGIAGPIAVVAQPLDGSKMQVLAESKDGLSKFSQGQFSPDGRWLLFLNLAMDTSRVQSIERVPAQGGPPEVVPTTGQIQEFHCSSATVGRCVLREVDGKQHLIYYALDPVRGMGQELARTPWESNMLGDWSLSPDGATVAMANHDPAHPGVHLIPLAADASVHQNSTLLKEISLTGFGTTLDANWASDGKSFFVETYSGTDYNLVWLALDGRATLLIYSPDLVYAIPSPDGKKIAFPETTPLNRNIWIGFSKSGSLL